jgi:hypothetical protein
MARTKKSPEAWQQATRDILDRLDLKAAFAWLGVDITGGEPNINGWLECRAFGFTDNSPSAGINVAGGHPERGRYKEFVGDGLNLNLFNFAVHAGKFPTWQDARAHFADVASVKLPSAKPPRHPTDSLEFRDYNPALVNSWCYKKPGITEPAVKLCGGRVATESERHTVVTLPVFGEFGLADDPVGWVSWNITGKPLEIWQGKGVPQKSVKMKTAAGSKAGWIGRHGLSVFPTAGEVWVTEGPTDMLGLVSAILEQAPDRIDQMAVVCNSAGAMERQALESVAIFSGKTVVVVPDCDTPGQTGCRRRAEAISEVAAKVLLVRLPFEIIENHGKDLRDYLGAGHTLADLRKLAEVAEIIRPKTTPAPSLADDSVVIGATTPATAASGDKPTSAGQPITFFERQIVEAIGLDVLGEIEGGRIKVFSEFHRKTDTILDIGKLSYQRLIQIAGPQVKSKVHQGTEQIPDLFSFSDVKEAIALLAGYRRIEENESGVGCWPGLDETGEQTSAIVLVGAGEAAVRNGQPGLTRITKPRYGGRLLDISTPTAWYNFDELNELVLSCDAAAAVEAVTDLENLFARWRWVHQVQAPKVLAGLVLATWVQALWAWRPQVSITGASNSGKTFLFKALEGIFGSLAITSSGSTAAGIRQAVSKSAAVMLLDEFESGRHRNEILEMLRASSRGDRVLRGTTGHKGIEFTLRHIAWTAGIESGLRREPDKNRFIRQELVCPPSKEMGKLNLPSEHELHHLGQRLLAVALTFALSARETASALRVLSVTGVDTRIVEGYAVPAACYAAAMGESDVGPASEVLMRMLKTVEQTENSNDTSQLLQDIIESEVVLDRGVRTTVGEIIDPKSRRIDPTKELCMERTGVGIVAHNQNEEWFFVAHKAACRYLLKGTFWENQNIDEILKRLPGAEKCKKRLAGGMPWGVIIPLSLVIQED